MLPKVAQATAGAEPQGHGPSTITQGLGEQGGRPGSREQQPGPHHPRHGTEPTGRVSTKTKLLHNRKLRTSPRIWQIILNYDKPVRLNI